MTSLLERAKKEATEGGFRLHPEGTFHGMIEDVTKRQLENGSVVYDVKVRTTEGVAKTGIFETSLEEMESGYGGKLTREKAEERYVRSIGRMIRLYTDLGFQAPDGATEKEVEAQCYGWLGHLKGLACSVVVKNDPHKAGRQFVFINAPHKEDQEPSSPTVGSAPTLASNDLENIPF